MIINFNNIYIFPNNTLGKYIYKTKNSGDIYIVQTDYINNNYYKIGITNNISKRIGNYRCGNIYEPRLHYYFNCPDILKFDKILKTNLLDFNVKREIYKGDIETIKNIIINSIKKEFNITISAIEPDIKECDLSECKYCNKCFYTSKDMFKHYFLCKKYKEGFINKPNNICKHCGKILSNYKKKWKHEKICKAKPSEEINDTITLLSNKIKNLNKKLQKKDNELLKKDKVIIKQEKELIKKEKEIAKKEKIINKTIINNNYIDNRKIVNYHLDYKEFGFETVDHLDDKYINNFLANPSKKIAKYIKDVYFNRDYPLNQTVRILDLKSGTGFIYEDNQWKMKSIKSITEKILRESLDKITSFNYDKKNYIKYEDVIEINDKDADNIDLSEEEKSTWFIVNETTEKYKLKLKNKKQDIEHIVKNYLEELTKKLNKHYTDNHTDKLDI